MYRKILMFAGLPAIFILLLIAVAAASATAPEPAGEKEDAKAVPAAVKVEVEKKEPTVPAPNTELLNFIGKDHQALMDAAAGGDSAYIASFDGKLAEFISSAGYMVSITVLRKNPYGMVVHINSFKVSGETVPADVDVLLYMKEYTPDAKLDLMIYPTALLITDSAKNLDIYAIDSLSAYKACCASLNQQMSSAANIADLKRQTATAQMQASIAQQQAEKAQQQAYMAQMQAQDAQRQANAAALQSYYSYQDRYINNNDDWYNNNNNGGYYYGSGPVIVYPWHRRPPFPPHPPRPRPCPRPEPGPKPEPRPKPEAGRQNNMRAGFVAENRAKLIPKPAPAPEVRPNPVSNSAAAPEARPIPAVKSDPTERTPKTFVFNGVSS